ncbi:hypothetical protein PINS_up005409 [Pythium insidiosum]|nr:hypothetical protein PINS_up005409 [Pythium insidiosum]
MAQRQEPHGALSSPSSRTKEQERLHASFVEDRHYLERMVGQSRAERQTRVDAVLSLKASIDQSSSHIQSRNAQVARREDARAELEAASFDELLQQGKNPYEVARRRRVVAAANAERRQIEEHIEEKQQQLLRRVDVEKAWLARRERLNDEQRAYERRYQREMGRAAVEARTTQYLVARTGKETLDPTGKAFRLFPSQETSVIPDRSFGLGRNLVHDAAQRHAIVEHVRRKPAHRNAAVPSPLLLPRLGQQPASSSSSSNNNNNSSNDSETASGNAVAAAAPAHRDGERPVAAVRPMSQPTPGQELQHVNHLGLPPPADQLERGQGGSRARAPLPPLKSKSDATATTTPDNSNRLGSKQPKRSVLEQRLLAEARERQKANIFTEQIVWGKPFTGQAFLSDPPELWFRDFEVGTPMSLTFTLTNVSHTFNHFRLLELDASIRELFEVTYDKPGRMSAGMSCRVTVVFTATVARDLQGVVPAIAQTGPFEIPLRCTCKKSVPVLPLREIVFKDVVAGERRTVALTLENAGALPLEYQLTSLMHPPGSASSRTPTPSTDAVTLGSSTASVSDGDVAEDADDELEAQRRQEQLLRLDDPATVASSVDVPPSTDAEAPATDTDAPLDSSESEAPETQSQQQEQAVEEEDPVRLQRALIAQRVAFSEQEAQLIQHVRTTVMTYRPEREDPDQGDDQDQDQRTVGPPVRWSSSSGTVRRTPRRRCRSRLRRSLRCASSTQRRSSSRFRRSRRRIGARNGRVPVSRRSRFRCRRTRPTSRSFSRTTRSTLRAASHRGSIAASSWCATVAKSPCRSTFACPSASRAASSSTRTWASCKAGRRRRRTPARSLFRSSSVRQRCRTTSCGGGSSASAGATPPSGSSRCRYRSSCPTKSFRFTCSSSRA